MGLTIKNKKDILMGSRNIIRFLIGGKMQDLYIETKDIMKNYNIVANKRLGQNFLIDENTLNTIIKSADVCEEDLIIEIGSGIRNLNQ